MRPFLGAVFLAFAGVIGCGALDGLSDYQECAGACADAELGLVDDVSLEPPLDASDSIVDGAASHPGDASEPVEANFEDVGAVSDSAAHSSVPSVEGGTGASVDAATEDATPPL